MYFSAYLDPFSTYIVQHSKEIKVLHKVTKYILTIDKKILGYSILIVQNQT